MKKSEVTTRQLNKAIKRINLYYIKSIARVVGVSPNAVRKWRDGVARPSGEHQKALVQAVEADQ